jgi:hypothetical protein
VGKRGAEIIDARGASSAASAANAAVDHVRDWVLGADGLRSMAVTSDGSYGVEEGLMSSFPVRVGGGSVHDRTGARRGRLRARPDRHHGERAQGGARRGARAGADLGPPTRQPWRASPGPPCGRARPSGARAARGRDSSA